MSETMTMHISAAREAWLDAARDAESIDATIRQLEASLADGKCQRELQQEVVNKAASDYAAERATEGANAVEGPDGALYTIRKARKRKGGGEPANPYVLEPVKR